MKKFTIYQTLSFILLIFFTLTSFAWDNSVELGYGHSHDPNHTKYYNSGFLLTSDIYPLKHTPRTYWSLNGALGQWYTSAPHNKNLTTAAMSLALRFYPWTDATNYPTYLLGTVGPAYLSSRHYGANTQAGNVTIQFNLGLGVELNNIDVNLRLSHYSNAYIARPDQGFTVLYLLSIGYLF
jgi:hypothetical protein